MEAHHIAWLIVAFIFFAAWALVRRSGDDLDREK